MNNLDPRDVSDFESMRDFFRNHPPYTNDMFSSDNNVDEVYTVAIRAAFPNAGDNLISVGDVARYKVMLLGLEIIDYSRHLDVHDMHVAYIGPAPVVRLPDGSSFFVDSAYDLAELRAMLNRPLQPPGVAG